MVTHDKSRLVSHNQHQSTELLDIEHHIIHSGLTQSMGNLFLLDALDMSPCRKLTNYPRLTLPADLMWRRTNRVEKCEVINEVCEKVVYCKPKLFQVLLGAEGNWLVENLADWFLHLLVIL